METAVWLIRALPGRIAGRANWRLAMRRFTDRAGLDWSAFETARPNGLPDRRVKPASVTVAFRCDDGSEVAMDLPVGALEGLTDEELLLLLTKGLK
jgi:hypothetical protein